MPGSMKPFPTLPESDVLYNATREIKSEIKKTDVRKYIMSKKIKPDRGIKSGQMQINHQVDDQTIKNLNGSGNNILCLCSFKRGYASFTSNNQVYCIKLRFILRNHCAESLTIVFIYSFPFPLYV